MKVWMVIASYHPHIGGAEIQAQRLAQALIRKGFDIRVLTRQHLRPGEPPLPARETVDGVPIVRVFSPGPVWLSTFFFVVFGFLHLLRHGRRDFYHAHDVGAPAWLALGTRSLLGGRSLVKMRSGLANYERRLASGRTRLMLGWLLRRTDRIQIVSREQAEVVRRLGAPAGKIVHIPNSVDTGYFRPPTETEKIAARSRLGIPVSARTVLSVGRLEPVKGLDLLLQAWVGLPAAVRRDSALILVGDGSERAPLERLCRELGAEGVRFAGLQSDVRAWYWSADLFALPSHSEGLSNALLEAMACGLPVIATRVGGALDFVKDEENGFFHPPGDAEALEAVLSMSLQRVAASDRMRLESRRSVEERADIRRIVEKFAQVYSQDGR